MFVFFISLKYETKSAHYFMSRAGVRERERDGGGGGEGYRCRNGRTKVDRRTEKERGQEAMTERKRMRRAGRGREGEKWD